MKEQLIEVVKKLKELDTKAETYLKTVPYEFSGLVCDNEFMNNTGLKVDLLAAQVFGNMYEDVCWFLYDWKPGRNSVQIVTADGTEWYIKTEDDYYQYLREQKDDQ